MISDPPKRLLILLSYFAVLQTLITRLTDTLNSGYTLEVKPEIARIIEAKKPAAAAHEKPKARFCAVAATRNLSKVTALLAGSVSTGVASR